MGVGFGRRVACGVWRAAGGCWGRVPHSAAAVCIMPFGQLEADRQSAAGAARSRSRIGSADGSASVRSAHRRRAHARPTWSCLRKSAISESS